MKPLTIVLAALLWAGAASGSEALVTPAEVAAHLGLPGPAPLLLDVRTAAEFAEGRVPGAINIPVQELEARLAELPRDRELVVYCRSGRRAATASALLREHGYTQVREMEGSLLAWREKGLPIEQ